MKNRDKKGDASMGVPGLYVQQQLDHHGLYVGIIPVMFSDVKNHNLSSPVAKTITSSGLSLTVG